VAPWENIFEHVSIDNFKMMGNNILKSLRVIENYREKEAILSTFHDDTIQGGHTGITKTFAKVQRHYYWKKDIKEYIKKCPQCQKSKTTKHTKTPLTITETPQRAFDIVICLKILF